MIKIDRAILIGLMPLTLLASNVEKLFDNKCASCHIKTIPTDKTNLVAPPLIEVMKHVKIVYPNRDEAVNFITDYALNPTKGKAINFIVEYSLNLTESSNLAHFKLMPSQKGNITPEELEKIAQWMFDNYPPANFKGRGQGRGQGRNR